MTTPRPLHEPALVRERLVRFLRSARESQRPWSQNDVARAIGKSAALISAFVNDDARGDVQDLCLRLTAFLDRQDEKAKAGDLTLPYVEIRQAQIATETLQYAAVHQEIVALIGDSGRGKTMAIRRFLATDPASVLVEASRIHGPSAVMQEICLALGEHDRGRQIALLKRIVYRLKTTPRLLIVDEANTLGYAALDILRTIHDRTGTGMVLAGTTMLEAKLVGTTPEAEQLARRVIFRRRLPEFTDEDAAQQIAATLPHLDAREVLTVFDPRPKSSPARVANVLKVSAKIAGGLDRVTLTHIKSALKLVA
ncbi:AAA family ATPase [Candidatus Nitrospira bockiana]